MSAFVIHFPEHMPLKAVSPLVKALAEIAEREGCRLECSGTTATLKRVYVPRSNVVPFPNRGEFAPPPSYTPPSAA